MNSLRYTLLPDGPSDRCLVPIINWVLDHHPAIAERGYIPQIADMRKVNQPASKLSERILQSIDQFPCDLLFIHRDAENEKLDSRAEEIRRATAKAEFSPCISIIPVRMTEAWLLIDESAIRKSADNPNGAAHLALPSCNTLETLPDPKRKLEHLLVKASEARGRRLAKFKRKLAFRRQRVAEFIDDFSPLKQLAAFQTFERETADVLSKF